MRNRTVLKMFGIIAPIFTYIFTMFFPGRKARVAAVECSNKCKIMALVQNLESYMDPEGKTPLESIVAKCYALGDFPALWAVEGVGKDLAEWNMARSENPARMLIDVTLDPKWDGAWLMLHAGIGLGFAKHYMDRLPANFTEKDIKHVVQRTVDLCRANSRPGYYGAAIESLGLVTRFMQNAAFCRRVHNALTEYAPDSVGFYWRGIGRSVYFHPINFMPGFLRPCRAIGMAAVEAPNHEMRETMLSGVAWPLTIVNMTNPEVMEWTLENHDDYFSGSPGFFNGVISTVVMRYDTTPNDPLIQKFLNHKPDPKNRTLCGLWNSKIRGSLETALKTVYPILKKHQHLDQVFRYQSLPALAARLEAGQTEATGR
ncbi:MAG: hypothetical protein ACRD8O_11475 [Bryobacteraceae bacterium]